MDSIRLWLPLVVAVLTNAAANLLMKVGAANPSLEGAADAKAGNAFNLATGVAILLFIANLVAYRLTLDQMRVSVAFPILVAGSLLLVTVAAALLPSINEKITATQAGGMLLIALGVCLVSRGG